MTAGTRCGQGGGTQGIKMKRNYATVRDVPLKPSVFMILTLF